MTTDQKQPREGRVFGLGEHSNIFKNAEGGRSDYGNLIMAALTGQSQSELIESATRHLSKEAREQFRKELAESGQVEATLLDAEDQFFQDYLRIRAGPSLIAPPIAPERLSRLVAENNALEPCIAAMVTNIACTGYKVVPRSGNLGDIEEGSAEDQMRDNIEDFLSEVDVGKSFMTVRKMLRRDLHETGNSYAVVERTLDGSFAFLRRAPAKSMRLIKLDDPVPVTVRVRRGGELVEMNTIRAERRYAQKVGTKLVYYKEYGASRDLDRVTGEWAPEGTRLPPAKRAHEIIHSKDIEDVRSPYGMPRWITQLPSVLGSRMAEEYNLAFFQTGGVPPVIVFVSGGMVSDKVTQSLDQYLTGQSSDKRRGIAVEIPTSGTIENEQPANVTVERFGADNTDSTWENYDERSELRVRRAFRLPGIFLGMADSYNFASAHASYVVAEAQVFSPERDEEDERFNMTIMREIDPDGNWLLQSNPLTVQDVNLMLRALEMLKDTKGVSLADWVDDVNQAGGTSVQLSEDYSDAVVGEGILAPPPPPTLPGAPPQAASEDGAGEEEGEGGETPPEAANAPAPPATPEPGVTSAQKREAQVLASRVGRAIGDYDWAEDPDTLAELLDLEKAYDDLTDGQREIVNQHIAPMIYTSSFLMAGAMADLSEAYMKAVCNEARRKMKETA